MPDSLELLSKRFWPKVKKTESCWMWVGNKNNRHYGVAVRDGKKYLAHRLAYELTIGPIPDGLVIDHLCRVKLCVNPTHLEAVSQKANTYRGLAPSATNAFKTHCEHGHEFTPENTLVRIGERGNARRECRTCKRALGAKWARMYRARKREEKL